MKINFESSNMKIDEDRENKNLIKILNKLIILIYTKSRYFYCIFFSTGFNFLLV